MLVFSRSGYRWKHIFIARVASVEHDINFTQANNFFLTPALASAFAFLWPCGTGIPACRAERSSAALRPSLLRDLRVEPPFVRTINRSSTNPSTPPPPLPTFVITACPERSRREGRQARGICISAFPPSSSVTSVNSKLRAFLPLSQFGKNLSSTPNLGFPPNLLVTNEI